MNDYQIYIIGNHKENRTEAEIVLKDSSSSNEKFIGSVFETEKGWVVEYENESEKAPDKEIQKAKEKLSDYVNRKGIVIDEGLTVAGHSLLLMLKSDGTAMGKKYNCV